MKSSISLTRASCGLFLWSIVALFPKYSHYKISLVSGSPITMFKVCRYETREETTLIINTENINKLCEKVSSRAPRYDRVIFENCKT